MTFAAGILSAVSSALQPLRGAFTNEVTLRQFFAEFGWDVMIAPGAVETVRTGFGLVDSLAAVDEVVERLDDDAADAAGLTQALRSALDTLVAAIKGLSAAPPQGLPAPFDQPAFWDELPPALGDHLVVCMLESEAPPLYGVMRLLGIIERADEAPIGPARLPYTRLAIRWDRLPRLVGDPAKLLQELYRWDDPSGEPFQADLLLLTLEDALRAQRLAARTEPIPPGLAERYYSGDPAAGQVRSLIIPLTIIADVGWSNYVEAGLILAPIPPSGQSAPPPAGIVLAPHVVGEVEAIGEAAGTGVTLILGGGFNLDGALGAEVRPTGIEVFAAAGATSIDAAVTVSAQPDTPWRLLGDPDSFRVEIGGFEAGLAVRGRLDSPEVEVRVGTGHGEIPQKIAVVIQMSDADGFLGAVLGKAPIRLEFAGAVVWSSRTGLHLEGGGGFEFSVPLHMDLRIAVIEAMTIALRGSGHGLTVDAGVAGRALLGPLTAVVEDIGLRASLTFAGDDGKLGPVSVGIGFKPPKGVGLALNAGAVMGGGYLFIDPDRGEYAGVLELALFGVVTVKAIGIITTRMPDGSAGFSLLIAMSVEFGTGIQLGFGFKLLAVGGIVGLNRTMKLQALAEGIRSGAIESVMFPRDVIANAPKIISDLRSFFPPQNGKFLIGPMVKLGWGTPTLASISVGIIIEIPGNIAIVGIVKVAIPAEDVARIVLQVAFIGAIEFDKHRVWFFASLFESRIVFLTIEGEIGLLVAFGDDANFVLTVGGFHPRFAPPPLPFPSPRRVAIDLINTPVARVRVEGYFAVTSNTVQFGARVDVFFGLSVLSVQGHLAIDALFQFSPFYFIVEISASFSVKAFGFGVFSVGVRGSLQGPAPWQIKGHGSISFLFFDIGVDFETTWGESENTEMPPIGILPILAGELNKAENWRAIPPAGINLLVSLRPMQSAEAAMILHPVGVLRVSQRAVPLDLTLDKIGAQKPSDVNRLSVAVTGSGLARKADALEPFAPAQFQNFSDAEKLSKPAFAPEHSGVDLSAAGEDIRSSVMVRRVVRYEEIIIDTFYKRFARRFRGYLGVLFTFFLDGAAVAHCELSKAVKTKLQPFEEKIDVRPETFTVAMQSTNQAYSAESMSFHSEASAREFMADRVAADSTLADAVHVIPSYEVAL